MKFEYWQEVPRDLPCRQWMGLTVLAYPVDGDKGVLATFSMATAGPTGEVLQLAYRYTSQARFGVPMQIPMTDEPCEKVWQKLEWLLSSKDLRVVVVPKLRQQQSKPLSPASVAVAAVLGVVVALLLFQISGPLAAAAALPVGAAVSAFLMFVWSRTWRPSIASAGRLELTPANIVQYARQRAKGERPELDRSAERKATLIAQIEAIKDAYGALFDDIVYRIENSAMFDSSVSTTQRFEAALWRVNDEALLTLALPELEDAAAELEISWSAARDNAEVLGLEHLPETARPAAGRASLAARLAASTSSEGERVASMTQVVRILDELKIHYLPRVNPRTLEIEAPN